jgi:hypothetical protein
MENLSEVSEDRQLPLDIRLPDYLWDHRFDGRAVLPAVEAMQLLAQSVRQFDPGCHVHRMADAGFERFLYLDEMSDGTVAAVFNHLRRHRDGSLSAVLTVKYRSPKMAITRTKTHVSVKFTPAGLPKQAPSAPPYEAARALPGSVFEVPVSTIYRYLVPFGPAYQNMASTLRITESGAVVDVKSPDFGGDTRPLGSPFPLDAVMHAACVWGQRFSPLVAFPVGLGRRIILKPTQNGESYRARVQFDPVRSTPAKLVFDLWIYDRHGELREAVSGLRMQDVSGGRLKPPDWIKEGL